MKNMTLICIAMLILAGGCDAKQFSDSTHPKDSKKVAKLPRSSNTAAKPRIIIDKSTIIVNGTQVWMGDSLENWKTALSGTPKCYFHKNSMAECVWHENGITIGTDRDDQSRVKFINLNINLHAPPDGIERLPTVPTASFKGYLELDGNAIRSTTEFRELLRASGPVRNLRCGGSDCAAPTGSFNDGASLYLNLNSRSVSGNILIFSISCLSMRICMDSVPEKKGSSGHTK